MSVQNLSDFSVEINQHIFYYGSIILVPLGIILNALQFVVFATAKPFKHGNIGFLLSIFVSIETFSLAYSFIVYRYLLNSGFDIQNENNFSCFTFIYFGRVVQQIPIYVQVFITFVNYLKVKYPFKFIFLRRKSMLLYSILIIIVFVCIINVPNLFYYFGYYDLNSNYSNGKIQCTNSHVMSIFSNVSNLFTRCIFPACLMITLDFLVGQTLKKSKMHLNKHDKLEKEKKFANILMLLDFIFVLFNLPISCAEILITIYQKILDYPDGSVTLASIKILHSVVTAFAYTFYFVPFFLNLFCNKVFRKELIYLISFHKRKNGVSNIESSNSQTSSHINFNKSIQAKALNNSKI